MTQREEQLSGARIFADAMTADMATNKTKIKQKIGILLSLRRAIADEDADKAMEAIKKYKNLTK